MVSGSSIYVTYRARHGIQTDGGAVHVATQYDAELGQMGANLDISGLRQSNYPAFSAEFRMTSDEPSMLSKGGNILWVDNWERLGGLNVSSGQLVHVGNVSNTWPECSLSEAAGAQPAAPTCGPGSSNPFFPLSGNPADPAYPFPSPGVTDGNARGGVVAANNMIYWRVIEGGLAGISHRVGSACPAPLVYTQTTLPAAALADYSPSWKDARPKRASAGQVVSYAIHVQNSGGLTGETLQVADTLPAGLAYVPGSLSASSGTIDDQDAPTLRWSGLLNSLSSVTITYQA